MATLSAFFLTGFALWPAGFHARFVAPEDELVTGGSDGVIRVWKMHGNPVSVCAL